MPPLKLLHDDETIRRRAGYEYWTRQRTDDIVDSLRPEGGAPLIVDDRGLVWNGNTRIFIRQQRGYDVDSLPRMAKPRSPIGDLDGLD